MKQDEIGLALIDIKSELELFQSLGDESHFQNALDKIDALGNALDFERFLNNIKRIVYAKMKESTGADSENYYNQYQLLKGATTFEEVQKIIG